MGITDSLTSLAVARSGTGDRIYVVATNGSDLWVASANNTGDAENATMWPKAGGGDFSNAHKNIAIVPYQGADKVLVVYAKDPGGSGSDGVARASRA